MKSKQESLESIMKFIKDAGSDDLNTFGGEYVGGVYCQQVPDELAPCLWSLMAMGVKINAYLEVGAAAGGTTFIFNHYFHPKQIVIVDDNSHPNCAKRSESLAGIKYSEIINDCHSREAVQLAGEMGPYDLIILDAVHSYESTRVCVNLYSPFLSPGGLLFLHDSVWRGGKVDWVVRELQEDKGWEFVGEWISPTHYANPCGIAIFRKAVAE